MSTSRFALLVALLAAIVAAGSFAVAYLVLDQDSVAPAPTTPAGTSPPDDAAPTSTALSTVPTTTTGARFTEPGELPTPTWVVVVVSGASRTDVDATARRLVNSGYAAGVLRTDGYSSLTKGLWVAYAGPYRDPDTAQATVDRLTGQGFEGTYARCVGEKRECSPSDHDD